MRREVEDFLLPVVARVEGDRREVGRLPIGRSGKPHVDVSRPLAILVVRVVPNLNHLDVYVFTCVGELGLGISSVNGAGVARLARKRVARNTRLGNGVGKTSGQALDGLRLVACEGNGSRAIGREVHAAVRFCLAQNIARTRAELDVEGELPLRGIARRQHQLLAELQVALGTLVGNGRRCDGASDLARNRARLARVGYGVEVGVVTLKDLLHGVSKACGQVGRRLGFIRLERKRCHALLVERHVAIRITHGLAVELVERYLNRKLLVHVVGHVTLHDLNNLEVAFVARVRERG